MLESASRTLTFSKRPWTCIVCRRNKWGPPLEKFGSKKAWGRVVRGLYRKWGRFCGAECEARWQKFERLLESNPRRPPSEVRLFLLERDRFRCWLCGRQVSVSSAHVDHIKAWSRGGRTALDNLKIACRNCNLLKHTAKLPKAVQHNLTHGGRVRSARIRAELEAQFAVQPYRHGMTRSERDLVREVEQLDADLTRALERTP